MQVSEETIEAMCKAHYERDGMATWGPLAAVMRDSWRADMRAALAVLPEPSVELERLERERDEASAGLAETRAALAEVVWAMEEWGSWEDGVPASDEPGAHGRVGKAYDNASQLLGYVRDGKRMSAILAAAQLAPTADKRPALQEVWEAIDELRRDNALLWRLVEGCAVGRMRLTECAREALGARKAGGQ